MYVGRRMNEKVAKCDAAILTIRCITFLSCYYVSITPHCLQHPVVGVSKLCLSVSCSARDHSACSGWPHLPVSKYSRRSLYITGHLPHLDTQVIKQTSHHSHHTFQHPLRSNGGIRFSYLLTSHVRPEPCKLH